MNLKIPNNKAIEILRKRIGELESYDFQPKVWKDKTQNDLKEIFPLGDTKWLQVSGIDFTTFISSEKEQVMRDGKVQARQLLESYIEQIQEYSKIQEEREIIEEDNYQKKYSDLLKEWNELVPSHNSLLKDKEQLHEIIDAKDGEIENRETEIDRLKKNTVQLDNISLIRLFKLISNLPIGQIIGLIIAVIGIVTGSFKLGEIYSNNKAENDKYEYRKSNDDLIRKNEDLNQKNKTLSERSDSLTQEIDSLNLKVQNLYKLIPEDFVEEPLFPLKIEISFSSPTSIFNGEVLLTAKDEYNDKATIEFKGILGVSNKPSEPFDSLMIEVQSGDRFYFKSERGQVYAVNVLSTTLDVDIEIIEKK